MSIFSTPDKQVKERVTRFFRLERSQDFKKYISVRELELRGYSRSTACISDISERRKAQSSESQVIRVFPGYTEVRNIKVEDGSTGQSRSDRGGKRGVVKDFSDKSRMGLMKLFCRNESPLPYWQDFTFPDDVMEGLGISGRADRAREIWKRFLRKCKDDGMEINGIVKREWKKRRHGRLFGQYVPHYHFLYNLGGQDQQFLKLAFAWVDSLKTEMYAEALSVAINPKSYRMVKSKKQAQKYVGEYVSKNEGFISTESIGRSWAIIGKLELAEPEEIHVTEKEAILLKRCFRKIYRNFRKNQNMRIRLRRKFTEFTMFLESSTIMRMIEEMRLFDLSGWFGEAAECVS